MEHDSIALIFKYLCEVCGGTIEEYILKAKEEGVDVARGLALLAKILGAYDASGKVHDKIECIDVKKVVDRDININEAMSLEEFTIIRSKKLLPLSFKVFGEDRMDVLIKRIEENIHRFQDYLIILNIIEERLKSSPLIEDFVALDTSDGISIVLVFKDEETAMRVYKRKKPDIVVHAYSNISAKKEGFDKAELVDVQLNDDKKSVTYVFRYV